MNRAAVVITVLVLSALACSIQTSPAAPTTLPPTVVKPANTATTVPTTPAEWTAKIAQTVVNVRSAPNGSVVGVVRTGESVVILSCSGAWCRVRKPDGADWKQETGFIFRGCLSDNPESLGCEAK